MAAKSIAVLVSLVLAMAVPFSGCGKADKIKDRIEGEISAKPGIEQPGNVSGEETGDAEEPKLPTTTTDKSAYPLSSADEDYLVLVNKTYHVTENYKADDLVTVTTCDPDVGTKETRMMRKTAADAFEVLAAASRDAGYNIVMRTGYRSYNYQKNLFESYAANHGEAEANKYSARPGQSEHQTGWCCDVGVRGRGLTSFNGSDEARWIADNSWKYGFILRYPENKTDITGYIYESWHIRYVGEEAAKYIYENDLTLEEYLGMVD